MVRRSALGLWLRSGGAAEDGLLEPLDSSAQVVTSTAGKRADVPLQLVAITYRLLVRCRAGAVSGQKCGSQQAHSLSHAGRHQATTADEFHLLVKADNTFEKSRRDGGIRTRGRLLPNPH